MYTYKQIGNKYVVSIQNHKEIVKALTVFCEEKNIILSRGPFMVLELSMN